MPNREATVDRYLYIEIANAVDSLNGTLTKIEKLVNHRQCGEALQELLRNARETQ